MRRRRKKTFQYLSNIWSNVMNLTKIRQGIFNNSISGRSYVKMLSWNNCARNLKEIIISREYQITVFNSWENSMRRRRKNFFQYMYNIWLNVMNLYKITQGICNKTISDWSWCDDVILTPPLFLQKFSLQFWIDLRNDQFDPKN